MFVSGLLMPYLAPMSKKDGEYSGIWMKVGCFLSALAIILILTLLVLVFYNLLVGN